MAAPDAATWVSRGREHQRHGRVVDALLCFRQAARAQDAPVDVALYLGEAYWQLGLRHEAIAAWRDATARAPSHLGAWHALADAAAEAGDFAAVAAAAASALAAADGCAWARGYARLADLGRAGGARPNGDDEAVGVLADALEADPALTRSPSFVALLAGVIDARAAGAQAKRLYDRLAAAGGEASGPAAPPAALHALLAERAVATSDARSLAALLEIAAGRSYEAGELHWLRRIALAAATAGSPRAGAFAAGYARLAIEQHGQRVPLLWPRRTAGGRPRVVLLLDSSALADAAAFVEFTAAQRERIDAMVVVVAVGGTPAAPAAPLAAAVSRALALPADPTLDDARRIAAFDPDVLLDGAGLAADTGRLLAARPARQVWSWRASRAPNAVPLVDEGPGAADLETLLGQLERAITGAAQCPVDAAAMAARWNEAVGLHRSGELDPALAAYDRVLELQPGFAPALYLRAVAAAAAGDGEAARAGLAAALAVAPAYDEARVAAAKAALDLGAADEAVRIGEQGLAAGRPSAPLWRSLGLAQLARRDGDKAAACFARALGEAPCDAETHYNFGVAMQMQRQFAEAARAYQRALFFDPALTAADFNLGVLFQEQGADEAAIAAYENVLRANPRQAGAYRNLGEVLFGVGRIDRWLANFERFEAHCPNALPLAVQALEACQYLADFPRLERYLDGLRNERFAAADEMELVDCLEQILYLLLFFDVEPEMLSRFAVTYDAAARRVYGEPLPRPERRRPGRIRVGYLSADLRDHVMGKMAWSAVEHSDKERFELFFYSLARHEDAWTGRFRGLANGYAVVADMSAAAAARRIAADDLDILVDLQTHTRGARPEILALKPARVLITHVASAGTVGLSAIDFKLTDRYADVPESQETMLERLLPMAGCVYPYRVLEPAGEHAYRREPLRIPADAFVVGAFVTGMKLSRRCLGLWRDVLDRIPRAQIAFSPSNAALRTQYLRLVRSVGIPPERVVFLPQGTTEAENLCRYHVVDVVLDPMPFGGVNGTLEALAMGVPVVTLVGKKHGERSTYSILANLGVEATVAGSGREYVELAVRLATEPAFAADVRAAIRAGLAASPLTDRAGHTRALEAAYVAALADRAPEVLAAQAGDR